MSEPKIIMPLLENYIMGQPISDHHGVRCCPALLKDTEKKYIVKIISHPASQVQLDALLLTGICRDENDARQYFARQAEDTVAEATLLQKLSLLEGFKSYDSWQTEPMDDQPGCDVYLLGEYCMTLARQLKEGLTHLAAVNLGLDLCAALSVCRRNGYLYVDLRPENVCFTESREYRICDLGFVSLASLKYTSLPDKYRSDYTAPEITDAYSSLNTTMDVYAVGLILYQVFNAGALPIPGEEMANPEYADYEMRQIILKACAAAPEDRWQDPQEMGQALIAYMQSHTVNDTPIIPQPEPEPEETECDPDLSEEESQQSEEDNNIEEVSDVQVEETEDIASESEPEVEDAQDSEEPAEPMDELEEAEQFVIDGFLFDDAEAQAPSEEELFSEEVDQMLAQADDLIAHKAPEPVVAPEPVDIPIPDPILPEPEPEPESDSDSEPQDDITVVQAPLETPEEESQPDIPQEDTDPESTPVPDQAGRKKLGTLIGILSAVLAILLLVSGFFYYRQNYYLQSVNGIIADTFEDQAIITLDTSIDNSLLTVICTDIYGNTKQLQPENNTVTFTSLTAGTTYKITLSIEGHHKLIGNTATSFTTAPQTNIVSFTAICADTDGSAILKFSVQGTDSQAWYVYYSTDNEPERSIPCNGHMATVTGLTVGKTYTFRLVPETELYLVGNDTLEYTALPVIYPENLTLHGYDSGKLLVSWNTPAGLAVESWTVRCYNNDGFDYTTTVTDTQIALEGLDPAIGYTVDVKAAGMSVSKWTTITANSITFRDLTLDDSVPGQLTVTWSHEGVAPSNGWQLTYSIDGGEKHILTCEETTATIFDLLPGSTYSIGFVLPEDITVFGGTAQYSVPFETFDAYGLTAEDFTLRMCWTPDREEWYWNQLWEEDFTNVFAPGENASFVIRGDAEIEAANVQMATLFLIRTADGTFVSITAGDPFDWGKWDGNYSQLDMPGLPAEPGDYQVQIFFDYQYVATVPFTVSAEIAAE